MGIAAKSETRGYRPESPILLEQLQNQTKSFLQRLQLHRTDGSLRFTQEKISFLDSFITSFAKTRNKRSDEVDTPEYGEALEHINSAELFPYSTFAVDCIDGRVLPILVGGFIAKFGGVLRLPAAQPKEFIINQAGEPTLRKNSNFANRLKDIFAKQDSDKKGEDTIIQILDSHLGCAAREAMSPGHTDKGLWVDIQEKRRMAKAMKRHVTKDHPNKRILPIQVSFDPAGGDLYMGLERDEVFLPVQADESYYSDKTQLLALAKNDKILSSKTISWRLASLGSNDEKKLFNNFEFEPKFDWRNEYVNSARQFWGYMGQMVHHKVLEKLIYPQMEAVYKDELKMMDPGEIKTRGLILLANAFSYYLHNRDEQGNLPNIGEVENKYYEHHTHRERCVTITEGGFAPFPADVDDQTGQNMDAFVVYSKDLDSLASNVLTAAQIVQANRREKRINDDVHMPVPVLLKEMVRNELNDDQWKRLELFDFSDLSENWIHWDINLLDNYMVKKQGIMSHSPITMVVWELMQKMQILYNGKNGLNTLLTDGDLVIVPVIADQDRRLRKIIPFTRNGLDD